MHSGDGDCILKQIEICWGCRWLYNQLLFEIFLSNVGCRWWPHCLDPAALVFMFFQSANGDCYPRGRRRNDVQKIGIQIEGAPGRVDIDFFQIRKYKVWTVDVSVAPLCFACFPWLTMMSLLMLMVKVNCFWDCTGRMARLHCFCCVLVVICSIMTRTSESMAGKATDYAWKDRLNREKEYMLLQREQMFWWKYYAMMNMQWPLAEMKQRTYMLKYQVEELKQENYNMVMDIVRMKKEITELKRESALLKMEKARKKG